METLKGEVKRGRNSQAVLTLCSKGGGSSEYVG